MFEYATEKLQDARIALDRLRSFIKPLVESNVKIISGPSGENGNVVGITEPVAFSEAFSSCIMQIRSVGDATLKLNEKVELKQLFDKHKIVKYIEWKTGIEDFHKTLNENEVIGFVHKSRIDNFHFGMSPISYALHGFNFSTDELGKKPSPDATWIIDGKGIFWLVNAGTPKERRIPCEIKDGFTFTASIINPPTMHLKKVLPSNDPITVCEIALNYYEELLFEAKKKFGT